ncbi:hypothetical protein [Rhodomicrobium vannielii]|uniref:hypothetical protein n=1 Tax=Rhodomicrobium vannielii TaxID=1069 RepID=UPI0012DBF1BB|nr:hypothetical protein [Rhodomicrobium vannielii]
MKKDIWSVKTALFFGGLRAFCAPPPTTGGVNTSQPPGAVMGSGPLRDAKLANAGRRSTAFCRIGDKRADTSQRAAVAILYANYFGAIIALTAGTPRKP